MMIYTKLRTITTNKQKKVHNNLCDDMSKFNCCVMSVHGEQLCMLELAGLLIDDIQGQGAGECKAITSK